MEIPLHLEDCPLCVHYDEPGNSQACVNCRHSKPRIYSGESRFQAAPSEQVILNLTAELNKLKARLREQHIIVD